MRDADDSSAAAMTDLGPWIRGLAPAYPWLTLPVIVVTGCCILAQPLGVAAAWLRPAGLRAATAAVGGAWLVTVVAHALAATWPRPRPFVALHLHPLFPHAADASFPSTTVAYCALAATVTLLAWRRVGVLLLAATAVVAFGCVYVRVHWVADVAAGEVLGVLSALACWAALGLPVFARALRALDRRLQSLRLRPALA